MAKYSFQNNGQSYDCITRLYLHENIQEAFIELLAAEAEKIKIGNPHDPETDLGPLCTQ